MGLPTPRRGPGRPPGSKTRVAEVVEQLSPAEISTVRKLPDTPEELNAALGMYKLLVSPCLTGVSGALEAAGSAPLSAKEHQEGTFAFSALAYQYGAQMDARLLVAFWLAGVSLPRITSALRDRKKNADPTPATIEAARNAPEKAAA